MADADNAAEPSNSSDLGVRTVTAIGMMAVSGLALWSGGWIWNIFVLMIGIGVWFEWSALCLLMYPPGSRRTIWRYSGAAYCGIACATLIELRALPEGVAFLLVLLGAVVATDIGAYFTGRTIGGPKIAPNISPSKTWSGLVGGMFASGMLIMGGLYLVVSAASALASANNSGPIWPAMLAGFGIGALVAIVAQTGDFFESWMKRRAGVKDSGKLLPGHGGLFDRVDGLLAVLFIGGLVFLGYSISRLM